MRNKMNIGMLLNRINKELDLLRTEGLEHSYSVATDAHMFLNCNFDYTQTVTALELGQKMDSSILKAEIKAYIWSHFEPMPDAHITDTIKEPVVKIEVVPFEEPQNVEFICFKDWFQFARSKETVQKVNSRTFDIQFKDAQKEIIIEGILFKVKEGTDYVMKPNATRFKNRVIQCNSYTALKKYLVKATFEDFWVSSIYPVLEKFVPEA